MRKWREMLGVALAGALVALASCTTGNSGSSSGGDGADPDLRKRLDDLATENAELKKRAEQLEKELRPLQKRVDEIDVQQQGLDRNLGNVRKDLESRVTDIIEQRLGRTGPRHFVRPVPAPIPPPVIAPMPVPAARFEDRPYIGFDGQDLLPEVAKELELKAKTGVLVTDVREGSPAALAGLKKHDVVQGIGAAEIKARGDIERALAGKRPQDDVTLIVLRDAQTVRLNLRLGVKRIPLEAPAP